MPTHIEHRGGRRPWKIVEDSTGRVVGSSETEIAAKIASGIRDREWAKKQNRKG